MKKIIFLITATIVTLLSDAFAWTITDNMDGTGTSNYYSTYHSTDYSFSAPNSAKFFLQQGDESVGIYQYNLGGDVHEGGELWVGVYLYVPEGFDWYANPITKLLRVAVAKSDGTSDDYHSILATRPGNYGCTGADSYGYMVTGSERNSGQTPPPICQNVASPAVFLTPGQWHYIELYVKVSSTNGILRAWHNGVLINEYSYPTVESGGYIPYNRTANWTVNHLLGWWNGGPTQDQYIYFDNLKATNEEPSATDSHGNRMMGPVYSPLVNYLRFGSGQSRLLSGTGRFVQ